MTCESMQVAIMSAVPRGIERGLRTHHSPERIDHREAAEQLDAFAGIIARHMPVLMRKRGQGDDSCFVQDVALEIEPGRVVLCSMAHQSRAHEPGALFHELLCKLVNPSRIHWPTSLAKFEGGDFIPYAGTWFGRAGENGHTRTDRAGFEELHGYVKIAGRNLGEVRVDEACLHLSTAVTVLGANSQGKVHAIAARDALIDYSAFHAANIQVHFLPANEAWAANCFAALTPYGGPVVMQAGFPESEKLVRELGYDVVTTDLSWFKLADGGPTCLVLLIHIPRPRSFKQLIRERQLPVRAILPEGME